MSAYREARARAAHHRFLVGCARCPASHVVEEPDEDSFVCARCHHEQPTLAIERAVFSGRAKDRQDLPAGVSSDSSESLDAFANRLGVRPPVTMITVDCEGIDIVVELATSSGHTLGVDLIARVRGFYAMDLLRETEAHVEAKRTALTVEVQTGDPAFDAEVFVQSALSHPDLAVTFSAPAVRAAVRAILQRTDSISVGEAEIRVSLRSHLAYDADTLCALLGDLRTLAAAPRSVSPTKEPPRPGVLLAMVLGGLGVPVGITVTAILLHHYAPFGPMIALVAVSFALVAFIVLQPLLHRLVAGRSRSHVDLMVLRVLSLVDLVLLGLSCLLYTNGALDRSPPRDLALPVSAVEYDSEEKEAIVIAWDGSTEHRLRFDDPQRKIHGPAHVTARFRWGRLGFGWKEGPATVHYLGTSATGH